MSQTAEQGMQVYITKLTEDDELFCHYSNETSPQEAVLALDLEDGELTARYNPQIGSGVPENVYNRRTLWIGIPTLTATAANQLLEDVKPIAQRILDGATIEEDRNLNSHGHLNDDAQAAYGELTEKCNPLNFDDSDTVSELDASDWFGGEGSEEVIKRLGLTADTTDEQITAMASEEEAEARNSSSHGYVLLVGAEEYLTDLRDELRDAEYERLDQVVEKIDDLTDKRDELVSRIRGWDVKSDREIGNLIGKSHTTVREIDQRVRREQRYTKLATALRALHAQHIADPESGLAVEYIPDNAPDGVYTVKPLAEITGRSGGVVITGSQLATDHPTLSLVESYTAARELAAGPQSETDKS